MNKIPKLDLKQIKKENWKKQKIHLKFTSLTRLNSVIFRSTIFSSIHSILIVLIKPPSQHVRQRARLRHVLHQHERLRRLVRRLRLVPVNDAVQRHAVHDRRYERQQRRAGGRHADPVPLGRLDRAPVREQEGDERGVEERFEGERGADHAPGGVSGVDGATGAEDEADPDDGEGGGGGDGETERQFVVQAIAGDDGLVVVVVKNLLYLIKA